MHNDLDGYDGLSYFGPGSQLQCKHSWTCNTGPPSSYQFPTGDLNLMNFSAEALNIFVSRQLLCRERDRESLSSFPFILWESTQVGI